MVRARSNDLRERVVTAVLAERGIAVSHDAIWRLLRREGLRFKKNDVRLEQARADIARRRRLWRSWQNRLDPDRLVFVDETWIKTNMAPIRGWGAKGKRLKGFAPQGHWRTLTFLAALRADALTAPCVFDSPINGRSFGAWIEQQLVPTLRQATSSSWTISAATNPQPSAKPSGPPAPG